MAHFVFSPINVNAAQISGSVSLVIYAFLVQWFSTEPAFYEKLDFSQGENCLLCHCSLYLVHNHMCDMTYVSTSKMKMLYLERISFCGGKEHRFGKQAACLLFHLLVVWPWESYLTHLCFNFFTYKLVMIIVISVSWKWYELTQYPLRVTAIWDLAVFSFRWSVSTPAILKGDDKIKIIPFLDWNSYLLSKRLSSLREGTYGCQRGRMWGRDSWRVWDQRVHTTIF